LSSSFFTYNPHSLDALISEKKLKFMSGVGGRRGVPSCLEGLPADAMDVRCSTACTINDELCAIRASAAGVASGRAAAWAFSKTTVFSLAATRKSTAKVSDERQ
jgi:hypothetical protein